LPERECEPDQREHGGHQDEAEERDLPRLRDLGQAVVERVVRAEQDRERRKRCDAPRV
jgi:hypothetical protein